MLYSIFINVVSTLIGGSLLALFFFWLKERVFNSPELFGKWYFEMETKNTDYKPYENMKLRYIAILYKEGDKVLGSVEKIYENSSTGERVYTGKERSRGYIEGFYQKNYLTKDKLFLHVNETGKERESTNYFELIRVDDLTFTGAFSSFVANQDGLTKWQREKFY